MQAKPANFPRIAALAALLLTVAITETPAQSTGGADASPPASSQAVNCADDRLGTVHRLPAQKCSGRVVSDEEAQVLRDQRRDYIRQVLARKTDNSVVGRSLAGLGSGFFVSSDGSVITSRHVVEGCAEVTVTPTFGEMKLATAVIPDDRADIALLRTSGGAPSIAPLVPRKGPEVIGPAFVIGYPELGMVTIEPVLTDVEVLHRESTTPFGPAIVVSGDVRKGNSGGPLLDGGGDVIGVVVAKVDSVNVYRTTGEVVREIGLALPSEVLHRFLASHGVTHREAQRRPPQPNARVLDNSRGFMAQIGCWK